MKIYSKTIWLTGIISVLSFLGAFWSVFFFDRCFSFLDCSFRNSIQNFTNNICFGIFTGGILSFITSAAGYKIEKQRTMERFFVCTKEIISHLQEYDSTWTDEKKAKFFLSCLKYTFIDWDMTYGDIGFLFDLCHKNQTYIFNQIYAPIQNLKKNIESNEFDLKNYLQILNHTFSLKSDDESEIPEGFFEFYKKFDKKRKDQCRQALKEKLQPLEDILLTKEVVKTPDDYDKTCKMYDTDYFFVKNINDELDGKYYLLMYGKKSV